jgi:hypothetical protein
MTNQSDPSVIFQRWKALLNARDKSYGSISGNFEELFNDFKQAGVLFETAHEYLPKAIKAHQPTASLAKSVFKARHKIGLFTDEKGFYDSWIQDIEDKGVTAFFEIYPIKSDEDKEEEDPEPKVFGNMSATEYKAQRKYADQFPVLNTEELEQKMQSGTYDPTKDIAQILKKEDDNG